MKTSTAVKNEINDLTKHDAINVKERNKQINQLRFLNAALKYLESGSASEEALKRMNARIERQLKRIDEVFYATFNIKNKEVESKRLKQYRKEQGANRMKRQVKMINYLLKN